MRRDDLTPYEAAARNTGYPDGWDLAESEGRIEAEDVLGRLVSMALHEFGENRNSWPMTFDDQGFVEVLTADGKKLDGGLSIHVWPNDHPPPHVHILKRSEKEHLRIDLATGEPDGELPPWASSKQVKNMKSLVVKHHELLAGWWEKNHGTKVTLLAAADC